MSTLPLHPAIVHIPLGLAFVVPLVALALALLWWRRRVPRLAFALVVGLQAVVVAGGVAAMQAGERDADRVERMIPEALVERHEERAEAFVWASALVLAGSMALLLVPAGAVTAAALVVTIGAGATAGLGAWAGEAGGALVYEHGAAAAFLPPGAARPGAPGAAAAERHREDDD